MRKTWLIPTLAAVVISGSSIGLTTAHAASTTSKQKVVQSKVTSENSEAKDVNESATLAKTAKINQAQAKATATQKVSGTVQNIQLENENGKGVYNVQVKTSNNKTVGVKVDDQTGKVVKVENNNDNQENGNVEGQSNENNTKGSEDQAGNEGNRSNEQDQGQVDQQD